MRLQRTIFLTVMLAILLQTLNAYAFPPQTFYQEGHDPYVQLRPWYAEMQAKIRQNPKFKILETELKGKKVTCVFIFGLQNKVKNLRVLESCGNRTLDSKVVELIKESEPFKSPPNKLPMEKGMGVVFGNSETAASNSSPEVFVLPYKTWGPHRFI
jgi:hypothetical protein